MSKLYYCLYKCFLVFQKSLWDTIKNKRGGEKVVAPRRKKTEPPLKMAANKTFQVSRQPQYKRDKPRSPLASLNEGKAVRERSLSKHSPIDAEEQTAFNFIHRQRSLTLSDQENIHHVQKNSPLVLLVPTKKVTHPGLLSVTPDALEGKLENKEIAKMLNRTLSPIGTPERFKKLMPHIQSVDSQVPATVKSDADDADSLLPRSPVLSLKDALALIESDLSHFNTSPRDINSTCDFSDSLESKNGSQHCEPDINVLKLLPDTPEVSESNEPRLTFFVSKTVVVSQAESDKATERVKKTSFNSATVTKSKAAPVEENCLSGRKIKKSRRRLLEKTLDVSDGSSQCESDPGSPWLPVIDPDTRTNRWHNSEEISSLCDDRGQAQQFISSSPMPTPVTFPVTSPPSVAPSRFSFSVTSPSPAVLSPITFTVISPSPSSPSSPLRCLTSSRNVRKPSPTAILPQLISAPLSVQESFPIHMAVKSKKRKSEEYLKSDGKIQGGGKTEQVKRTKVVAVKSVQTRSVQERRSTSQRQQPRAAGGQI